MTRLAGIVLAAGCVFPATVRAEGFVISLQLSDAKSRQSADTRTDEPQAALPATADPARRPALESAKGSRLTASWKVANPSRQSREDVLVHFYVVRIDKVGQAPPPLEPHEVTLETAGTMDLAPAGVTSAELQFAPERPGIYLVRVETPASDQTRGQTYYAAIDLIVK